MFQITAAATAKASAAMIAALFVPALLVSVSPVASAPATSTIGRTQIVSVSAPWPTSCLSPLAEAAEFVAEGGSNPDLIWKYVEALGEAPQWVFSCAADNDVADTMTMITDGMEGAMAVAMAAAGAGVDGNRNRQEGGVGGVELDDLSLKLMEIALGARCVSVYNLNAGTRALELYTICCAYLISSWRFACVAQQVS